MHRRHITAAAAVALVACFAAGAAAQTTPAQAEKAFAKELSAALKELKTSLAEAKSTFFAELATFEAAVKGGNYDTAAVEALFEDLQTMMGHIGQAVRVTGNDTSIAASAALGDLAIGGPLNGVFPDAFYPGNGAPIDTLRAAGHALQDKTIAAVAKRLKKTRALVEKHANVGMTVVLAAPGHMRDLTWDETGGSFLSDESPITCDALIAVSDLAQLSDGLICIGGTANPNLGAVDLTLAGPEDHTPSGGVPTVVFERWSLVFDNAGAGLDEGVYIVAASQGTGGSRATASIGAR